MAPPEPQPDLPRFCDPFEGVAVSKPPFSFQGMTARVFPLRASIDTLQSFVDSYLNIVPEEVGRFRAAAPYVQLMLLDYGRMAQKGGAGNTQGNMGRPERIEPTVTNAGWISQKEIVFSVPLEWYKVENGRWIFHDWATVAPFIFVDDVLSMGEGRTVYGWPKTLVSLSPTIARWMTDPLAEVTEATVSTGVFHELYTGSKLEERTFLEVKRPASLAPLTFPVDLKNVFAPWVVAANVAEAAAGLSRDMLGLLRGLGVVPTNDATSFENYTSMFAKMAKTTFPLRPALGGNTLNLKQFRSSGHPERFDFQALTNGPMHVTALNRMGVLGQEHMVLGDLSGGYSIKLHEWPSVPIVDTLGLDVARRFDGPETSVAELKPVLPYWYDANMDYLAGSNLAYRGEETGIWHEGGTGRALPHSAKSISFNSTLGSALDSVAGPFVFTETTIRVLPLVAEKKKLDEFLDRYINAALPDRTRERFSLWSSGSEHAYVYLSMTDIGDVVSTNNNIGDWASYELMFLVPVKHEEKSADRAAGWDLLGVGLVPAFAYVDGAIAAVARSEVVGIPTTPSTFDLPETTWVATKGSLSATAEVGQDLLHLSVEILPAIGEGQKADTRRIASLIQGTLGHNHGRDAWRPFFGPWTSVLKGELDRKKQLQEDEPESLLNLLALALELLGNRQPFSLYTVKQFRDVENPDLACYQSIVRIPRSFSTVFDLREIEEPLIMRIHDFPTQPIAKTLGLVGLEVNDSDSGIALELQPVRPFTLRVTMNEGLGKEITHNTGGVRPGGGAAETKSEHEVEYYLPPARYDADGPGAPKKHIKVGQRLVAELDQIDPRRIAEATFSFWKNASPKEFLDSKTARQAMKAIDPQLVVETILSREWGNWDPNTRSMQGYTALVNQHKTSLDGVSPERFAASEHEFFTAVLENTGMARDSIWYDRGLTKTFSPDDMLDRLKLLSEASSEMKKQWWSLGELGIWQTAGPTTKRSSAEDKVKAIRDFLKSTTSFAKPELQVDNPSPVAGIGRAITANRETYLVLRKSKSIRELEKAIDAAGAASATDADKTNALKKAGAAQESVLRMARLVQVWEASQRETVFDLLSGFWEKPDFVVRRDAAGPDVDNVDRLFPRDESFDDTWYDGHPVGQ